MSPSAMKLADDSDVAVAPNVTHPATAAAAAAAAPVSAGIRVNSPDVVYTESHIKSTYIYRNTSVATAADGSLVATPIETTYRFETERKVPRTGLMMVGWGGNNGSTLTASIIANRLGISWRTKEGVQQPNYFGSLVQASTLKLGVNAKGEDVYIPFRNILPMVDPNNLVLGGWDISSTNLAAAMERAKVLDWDLQRQVAPHMVNMVPLPSVYFPDFIAANQSDRADNLIRGSMSEQLERIRSDIRHFKEVNQLESLIVIWTANTERYADIIPGVNDTADNLLASIKAGHSEIAPSTLFAVASVLEKVPFINGSPQNTFVPGMIDLAEKNRIFVGGDDFKSGQTKIKSVLVDFLVSAGIKPVAITSYNHLGNNDGKNLSAPLQFRSKEISKSNVVDDMVASNYILYKPNEHPDHTVVIKYVPAVGDSKRALDEYVSEIFMGGRNTIAIHNTCEDSLLASPLILDLVIITELMTRVRYEIVGSSEGLQPFHSVLSLLSYMLKAPVVPEGAPVINALSKQRAALENIFRAFVGLPPTSDMGLEQKAFH